MTTPCLVHETWVASNFSQMITQETFLSPSQALEQDFLTGQVSGEPDSCACVCMCACVRVCVCYMHACTRVHFQLAVTLPNRCPKSSRCGAEASCLRQSLHATCCPGAARKFLAWVVLAGREWQEDLVSWVSQQSRAGRPDPWRGS
jgi:hypothetical protein